ncbi:MAG: hypothetical protein J5562_09650, partial [Clostridia bacterium]|nr:hypothetical protein [Clostridia bacterium]
YTKYSCAFCLVLTPKSEFLRCEAILKQKFFVRTINKKGIRLAPIPFFEAVMAEKSISKSIKSLSCAPFRVALIFLTVFT